MSTTDSTDLSDLRGTLLVHAVELTRGSGPEAVSLREVQRRSGVSPAAAYRHYRSRQALLVAVGQFASRVLAGHIAAAQTAVDLPAGPDAASERLRAGCHAYLDFALTEPGLFRALLLPEERPGALVEPDAPSRGEGGVGPFQLLRTALEAFAAHDQMAADALPWSDTAVWAACHGLGVLLLDGPLRHLEANEREAATQRLIDVLIGGLSAPPGEPEQPVRHTSLPPLRIGSVRDPVPDRR